MITLRVSSFYAYAILIVSVGWFARRERMSWKPGETFFSSCQDPGNFCCTTKDDAPVTKGTQGVQLGRGVKTQYAHGKLH